jgi:hypothetical protein
VAKQSLFSSASNGLMWLRGKEGGNISRKAHPYYYSMHCVNFFLSKEIIPFSSPFSPI